MVFGNISKEITDVKVINVQQTTNTFGCAENKKRSFFSHTLSPKNNAVIFLPPHGDGKIMPLFFLPHTEAQKITPLFFLPHTEAEK
jgi:hypothetical protein